MKLAERRGESDKTANGSLSVGEFLDFLTTFLDLLFPFVGCLTIKE